MEEDNKKMALANKDNKLAINNNPTSALITVSELERIETLAKHLAKSSVYTKEFRDKDGNVNEGDVLAAIILGHEMGITPMASLMLGKRLNSDSYFSVLKGRELGIGAISSIMKVYNIDTSRGKVIALAVDIIIAKILESGTRYIYLRDFEPTKTYSTIGGKYIGHKHLLCDDKGNIKDDYFLYVKDVTSIDDVKKANQKGKIVIKEHGITNVTSVRFIRKVPDINIVIHYSLQEVIDAGLYRGFHSELIDEKGKPLFIKGKANWNNHPATHLRHRPLSIGGRLVVADKLLGAYSIEEAIEIVDDNKVQSEEDLIEHNYQKNKPDFTEKVEAEDIEVEIEDNK